MQNKLSDIVGGSLSHNVKSKQFCLLEFLFCFFYSVLFLPYRSFVYILWFWVLEFYGISVCASVCFYILKKYSGKMGRRKRD